MEMNFDKESKMPARAGELREVPGPKTRQWLEDARRLFFRSVVDSEIVAERFAGPYVYDPDGNEYLDFTSGIGVGSFGGGNDIRHIWDAIQDLRGRCGTCGDLGADWYNTEMVRAASYILPRVPLAGGENKIYFATSGTLANEAALTLPWAYFHDRGQVGRKTICCWEGAFHGRSGFMIKLLDPGKQVRFRGYPMPDYPVIRAPFPEASLKNPVQTVKEFLGNIKRGARRKVAAVIMEVIQGEGGIRVSEAEALQFWVDAWREEGALIIFDEVQMGIGRTGKLMSYEHFGVRPDIVTLAKHFAGGIPAAAMIGPAWADWVELGRRAESFQGAPIVAAASHATFKHVFEHGVLWRNQKLGSFLQQLLKARVAEALDCVKEVRGIGLAHGVEFKDILVRDRVMYHAERLGLRVAGAGFSSIRILVSFASTPEEIELGVDIFARAIKLATR